MVFKIVDYFSRHHHAHHSKFRKYSLPDDPAARQRHVAKEKIDNVPFNKNRRVSTQPEDLPLTAADRDQLDSHRSDDPKALRRHKFSRPSVASMVHIARREGGDQFNNVYFKKMYDHSPHAVRIEPVSERFYFISNSHLQIDIC